MTYYQGTSGVPASVRGQGGLGNFWHGVIPTSRSTAWPGHDDTQFATLFDRYYPHARIRDKLGLPFLFVPHTPIRPRTEWKRLVAEKSGTLVLMPGVARRINAAAKGMTVEADGIMHRATHVWCCAGAIGTPALMEASFGAGFARRTADDHVIGYLGIKRNAEPDDPVRPSVERVRGGMWLPSMPVADARSLLTFRPARFDFATLDAGFAKRAVFGLPARQLLARLFSGPSPGLVSEALFNKFGLFARACHFSAYTQTLVADAYGLDPATGSLSARSDVIRAAMDHARLSLVIEGLTPSERPDLFLPGIHLHHTIDARALEAAGLTGDRAALVIADASVLSNIGPEHHSFRMMAAAFGKAELVSGA